MTRIFPTVVKRATVVSSGGSIPDVPQIALHDPEVQPNPTSVDGIGVLDIDFSHPDPTTVENVALGIVEETTAPTPLDQEAVGLVDLTVHPDPTEVAAYGAGALEVAPDPTGTEAVGLGDLQTHPDPIDGSTLDVIEHEFATHPDAIDTVAFGFNPQEVHPDPTADERPGIGVVEDAVHPAPTETALLVVLEHEFATPPTPVAVHAFGFHPLLTHPDPTSEQRLLANWYPWASGVTQTAVSGRTDWATIANAEGNTPSTASTLTGNLTAARHGQLNLNFADVPTNWDTESLVIDTVTYTLYFLRDSMVVTTLGNFIITESTTAAGVQVYNPNTTALLTADNQEAGWVRTAVEPAGGWTWALINSFVLKISTGTPAGNNGTTHSVWRAQLRITAHKDYN